MIKEHGLTGVAKRAVGVDRVNLCLDVVGQGADNEEDELQSDRFPLEGLRCLPEWFQNPVQVLCVDPVLVIRDGYACSPGRSFITSRADTRLLLSSKHPKSRTMTNA